MVSARIMVREAATALGQRQDTFTVDEILAEMRLIYGEREYGSKTLSTYVTHITSRCCANSPKNHPRVYNYLWRIGTGVYRLFDPATDEPHPSRVLNS